jgi:uncharacterized membrane protein
MRLSFGRRRHFAHWHCHQHRHRQTPARPQPNAFERLKQRYVQGEIDVEQFEREVDALLRSPEMRKVVP